MQDYYRVLGVEGDASSEDLRKRYLFLAQAYHPDRFREPGNRAQAEQHFKEIQEAYTALADPRRRAEHDRARRWRGRPAGADPRRRHSDPGPTTDPARSRYPGDEPQVRAASSIESAPDPAPEAGARGKGKVLGHSPAQWVVAALLLANLVVPDPIPLLDEMALLFLFFTIDKILAPFTRR